MNTFSLAECMITVTDVGSIYKAAAKLNQTTAAISKKITSLEKYLGVQLMSRGRKGVTLTEAGQRYYHEAKIALAQLHTAELSVKQLKTIPQGKLKVVCNQFYAKTKILPKLKNFLVQYPKIALHLEIAEILPDFNLNKMDILFGVSLPGQDHLVQKKITQTKYILCASPDYLKKTTIPHTPAELLQHAFLAHAKRTKNQSVFLDNYQEIILQPNILIDNTETLIQAAIAGLGVLWTHENMVETYLKNKTLKTLLSSYTQEVINIYAYYAYQKYHDPKIKAFLDFFK